jgi:hypothetical protein
MVFVELLHRERLRAYDAAASAFCLEFQKFVQEENLKLNPIHSADESQLYWKGSPTRTPAFERENCALRHKSSEECLMVVCCGNASGNHKHYYIIPFHIPLLQPERSMDG